uniref:Zinc finger CCCH domain-containing protein 55-like n=1 Tax=Rhizophora mucronata TaxID=61149 RepID=A0A2P2LH84_RHIMU
MDHNEAKRVLLIKINTLDPENASRIMGFLLLKGLSDGDLLRLAFGPDIHLYNVIINAKTQLGLFTNSLSSSSSSTSTPSSPSPLNPLSSACNGNNPFSQSSPKVAGGGSFADFGNNQNESRNQSPQSTVLSGSKSNGNSNTSSNISLSPKASPFLSYDNIRSGSALLPRPPFSKNGGDSGDNDGDFFDDSRIDDYLSFLDDTSSRNEELLELRSQLSSYSANNGDFNSHKRGFPESDASFRAEDEGLGIGSRPCMYFAKGFCKNGDRCKFVHGCFDGDHAVEVNGVGGGGLFQQRQDEEMLRMKAARLKQQLAYTKFMDFLLQQRNDHQRLGTAAVMGDKFQKLGRYHPERNDLLAMGMAKRANPAARQIYLTFPADSTFKDEDVLNYFSTFGPVRDVRIPHQQKRMFGFITFVHPETVKIILARGNPHFICDSRVLVKPYKEKGKVANDRTQQLLDRGNFPTFSSSSGFDPRELYDLRFGTRLQYNNQAMILRRKLEEQAELQQAIELQGRRLMNLQLPDIREAYNHCHQCSLSVGAPISLPTQTPLAQNVFCTSDGKNQEVQGNQDNFGAACTSIFNAPGKKFQQEINLPWSQKNDRLNGKEGSFISETCDAHECHEGNVELALPDSLFSSPANSSGNQQPAFSTDLTEIKDTAELAFTSASEDESSILITSASNGSS